MSDKPQKHVDNFLAHYGTKSMKSSRRLTDSQLASAEKKRKEASRKEDKRT